MATHQRRGYHRAGWRLSSPAAVGEGWPQHQPPRGAWTGCTSPVTTCSWEIVCCCYNKVIYDVPSSVALTSYPGFSNLVINSMNSKVLKFKNRIITIFSSWYCLLWFRFLNITTTQTNLTLPIVSFIMWYLCTPIVRWKALNKLFLFPVYPAKTHAHAATVDHGGLPL